MLNKITDFFFRIDLFLLFFLFITPIGLLLRLAGKNYLSTNFNKRENTYWITHRSTLPVRRKDTL